MFVTTKLGIFIEKPGNFAARTGCFKPKHDIFCILTKWFSRLNETGPRALAQNVIKNINIKECFNIPVVRGEDCEQISFIQYKFNIEN